MKKAILILLLLMYNATDAQVSSSMVVRDTRAVNDLPNFSRQEIRADFKERRTIGVPGAGFYSTNLTLSPWRNDDNSGEKNYQINFNPGGIFYRNAYPLDAQWGTWRQILMENENGKVGIGTPAPTEKLDVNGNINMAGVAGRRLFMGGAGGTTFGIAYDSNSPNYGIFYTEAEPDYVSISPNGNANAGVMNIFGNGNIGVGTTTPGAKLDVFGANSDATNVILSANYVNKYRWRLKTKDRGNAIDMDFTASDVNDIQEDVLKLSRSNSGRPEFQLYNNTIVANDGKVGIGTSIPDSKLTVNGDIHATEVKVTQNVPADYVFEKYYLGESSLKPDYTLLTLSEVEKFTEANHHLPNVPSAKEIKENGLLVGEMSNVLLQKIEELTLYVIEQNKRIEKLEIENKKILKNK